MGLSQFFIKKSIFCIVTFLLILLIGILSLNQLPLRQYPDVEKSEITIDTRYPGSAASTVETKITEIIADFFILIFYNFLLNQTKFKMLDLNDNKSGGLLSTKKLFFNSCISP